MRISSRNTNWELFNQHCWDYRPYNSDNMETIGVGQDDYYETYVFSCDGEDKYGNPNITDLTEIEGVRYKDSISAEKGHREMCNKYDGLT